MRLSHLLRCRTLTLAAEADGTPICDHSRVNGIKIHLKV